MSLEIAAALFPLGWRWGPSGLAMLGVTAGFLAVTGYVWWRRAGSAGNALVVVLVANLVWSAAYAVELSAHHLDARQSWGDVKYVGICLLPPPGSRSRPSSPAAAAG